MRVGLVTPWAREHLTADDMDTLYAAEPQGAWLNLESAGRGFQARIADPSGTRAVATGYTPIEAFRTAQRNLLDELAAVAA